MEISKETKKLAKIIKAKRDLILLKNKQSLIQTHLENCKIEIKNIYIDPKSVVDGDSQKYMCAVCKGIVVQNSTFLADFCSKCEKIYCNGCVLGLSPCCKAQVGNSNELKLAELLPLYNMKFSCRAQDCQTKNQDLTFYYSKYVSHLSDKCPSILVTCPYGCSKMEMTRAQLTEHILEEKCPTERPFCDICHEFFQDGDENGHSCFSVALSNFLHDMVLKRKNSA